MKYKYLIFQLVKQNLTTKYRRTVFGFVWSLFNPLLTMAATATVFSMITRIPIEKFALVVFSGFLAWGVFSNCIMVSGGAFIQNEGMIKKVYVPRYIFPLSASLGCLIDQFFSAAALLILLTFIGGGVSYSLLSLPLAFLLVFLFSFGIGILMSIVFVYFRDMQYIVGVLLQIGYYLTPVMYTVDMVPEKYRFIFYMNPMTWFVDLFREPILNERMASFSIYSGCAGLAVLSLTVGLYFYNRYSKLIIFRL